MRMDTRDYPIRIQVCAECGRTTVLAPNGTTPRDPRTPLERRQIWEQHGLAHTFARRPDDRPWRAGDPQHYCRPPGDS